MAWGKRHPPDVLAYMQLTNKPEWVNRPSPQNWVMWQAFNHLRGSRNFGGSIPFSEITNYCMWAGINCPVQQWRVAAVVIALDNAERPHGPSSSDGPKPD